METPDSLYVMVEKPFQRDKIFIVLTQAREGEE